MNETTKFTPPLVLPEDLEGLDGLYRKAAEAEARSVCWIVCTKVRRLMNELGGLPVSQVHEWKDRTRLVYSTLSAEERIDLKARREQGV